MNITTLPLGSDLEIALYELQRAGIGYEVVCEGPDPVCPDWTAAAAA